MITRARRPVKLTDMGQKDDKIPNMVIANAIVAKKNLVMPPPEEPAITPTPKKQGRPAKQGKSAKRE